jgi:hypothetical protein
MATSPSRRRFLEAGLGTLAGAAFLQTLFAQDLLPPAVRPVFARWLRDLNGRCADLRAASVPPTVWQQETVRLFEHVPLADLLRAIDFEQLVRRTALPDDRATTTDPVFPAVEGVPARPSYVRRVFLLARDRAIVPHGHRNMVSCHLVIHGSLHVRHYERVRDEPDHLLLRPSIDRESPPGMATSVSDQKDNVHWLVATSPVAATFDVIVPGLDPARPTEFQDFVDPRRAVALGDGTLRAPRLSSREVFERYGKSGSRA